MSLRTLFNTEQTVKFGGDITIKDRDLYVNGDLAVLGAINGNATPANLDNTWTGTNEFSVLPLSEYVATAGGEVPNFNAMDAYFVANSAIHITNSWTGKQTFTQTPTLLLDPVGATDAVRGSYLKSTVDAVKGDYLTANNAWTGINTFNTTPYAQNPVSAQQAASKLYCDNTLIGGAVSISSSEEGTGAVVKTQADYPANTKIITTQLIGGGGGSTSSVGDCTCASAGVSGGSGGVGTFVCLVDSSTIDFNMSWNNGGGGGAGSGCGTGSEGKNGGGSTFNAYIGSGATPDCPAALTSGWQAGGGGGCNASCGEAGTANGGNPKFTNTGGLENGGVVSLYSGFSGRDGKQCLGANPNFFTIKDATNNISYGQGGSGATCQSGQSGKTGGYGQVSYIS